MKFFNRNSIAAALLVVVVSSTAFAEVASLHAKFKGGGRVSNTTGSVSIAVTASGSDLATDSVQLWVAEGAGKSFKKVSNRLRVLSTTGTATFRVKNIPGGCYKVVTGPNGNDKPDHASNVICES